MKKHILIGTGAGIAFTRAGTTGTMYNLGVIDAVDSGSVTGGIMRFGTANSSKVMTERMMDLWDEIRGLGIDEGSLVSDKKVNEIRNKYATVV